ncbi:MAG: hypothetical protein HUJ68_04260, partial [Clostridia bacterium]|nr:hypothetical protein [Clostridia bacterium]
MEVLLLGMTNFIAYMDQDETGSFIKKKNRLILKIAYYSLLAGDTVLLLSNFKTSLVFEISPVIIDDVFTSWTVTFKPLILVHVVICLSAQITMIYILVKYIIISHKIKRPAYITSLIVLSFTLVIEFLYFLLSNQILYNFSAIFLAVVIIILFLVFFYTAPRYVQKNLMIINCENVSDAIICFDENNRFTYGNKSGLELYKNKDVVSHLEKYIHIKNDVYADTEKIEI